MQVKKRNKGQKYDKKIHVETFYKDGKKMVSMWNIMLMDHYISKLL